MSLAKQIGAVPREYSNNNPLWKGPCAPGPLGGITQSMVARFLSCRERFRLKYVLGLEPMEKWNHRMGYGNMWHVCEEAHAKGTDWVVSLNRHIGVMGYQFPMQREEINKWGNVCAVQFPEYVRYWAEHPDVQNRKPLMQEQVFDVPYTLPSKRVVRLRGRFDSVDLIDGAIWLQENKTKGDIDQTQIERKLKFDLQTMLYIVALETVAPLAGVKTAGVRYNVVRRPLSGGKGTIRPHSAKATKTKFTPAETDEEFFERLRRDYIAAEPGYWFFRVRTEISARDVRKFKDTCLDSLLETICCWHDFVTEKKWHGDTRACPPMNYRTPFGGYNALDDDGATEYDAYLDTGSTAGLRVTNELFKELK